MAAQAVVLEVLACFTASCAPNTVSIKTHLGEVRLITIQLASPFGRQETQVGLATCAESRASTASDTFGVAWLAHFTSD